LLTLLHILISDISVGHKLGLLKLTFIL